MHKKKIFILAALAAALPGCANIPGGGTAGLGSGDYSRQQSRQAQQVQMGTVQASRAVKIEGGSSGIGIAAGAALGGLAGSKAGGGHGQQIMAVLGAIGGGVAGSATEKAMTGAAGVEITVKLDAGQVLAVTQAAEPGEDFHAGDRVRVLTGGGAVRVAH